MEYVVIHEKDNVKVCLSDGHKYAVRKQPMRTEQP